LALGAPWPVPPTDVLPSLRSLGLSTLSSMLVGVLVDATSRSQSIAWLAVRATPNLHAERSNDRLRSEAEWYEGLAQDANVHAAASGSALRCWQTSAAYVWMEALDEAVSGTAGCVISGALLTAATLLFCTASVSLTLSTLAGVLAVLVCFVGYLVERGYELGVVEAIATTIFIGFACDYCVHVAQVQRSSHGSFARVLEHAGPSLYGAALTTAASAAPLMLCEVVLFQQMGEFIVVCTAISLLVALTLIAPVVHICTSPTQPDGTSGVVAAVRGKLPQQPADHHESTTSDVPRIAAPSADESTAPSNAARAMGGTCSASTTSMWSLTASIEGGQLDDGRRHVTQLRPSAIVLDGAAVGLGYRQGSDATNTIISTRRSSANL